MPGCEKRGGSQCRNLQKRLTCLLLISVVLSQESATHHLLPDGSQVARDELLVAAGHAPVNFRNFMGRQDVISIYEDMLAKNPGDFKAFIFLQYFWVQIIGL